MTWAKDPYDAYYRLESMEFYAKILLLTDRILGKQRTLSEEEVARLIAMREKFGIAKGGYPKWKE